MGHRASTILHYSFEWTATCGPPPDSAIQAPRSIPFLPFYGLMSSPVNFFTRQYWGTWISAVKIGMKKMTSIFLCYINFSQLRRDNLLWLKSLSCSFSWISETNREQCRMESDTHLWCAMNIAHCLCNIWTYENRLSKSLFWVVRSDRQVSIFGGESTSHVQTKSQDLTKRHDYRSNALLVPNRTNALLWL